MKFKNSNYYANKIVNAFLKKKIIAPLPTRYTKNLVKADNFRKLCESKIDKPITGFKAGGTGIPLLKKLKEKEPFYASVYKHNIIKNNGNIKINKYTLGIELEVGYKIDKKFFNFKKRISKNDIKKIILKIFPCIEIVGYRQKKKGIKSFGDLSSDFGGNIKFVIGNEKRPNNINVNNLKTVIYNKKVNQLVKGNTNTVYKNPKNSLFFVLKKLQKSKIKFNNNFYVFTGSTVGVVPILKKGSYIGKIDKLGIVKANIN